MDGDGLKGLLGTVLETALVVALPALYTLFFIYLALYLNAVYNVAGFITIPAALLPMIAICAKVVYKRERKALEAQIKSFKVSPELHERALKDYLSLLPKKDEEKTQKEDSQSEEKSKTRFTRKSDI